MGHFLLRYFSRGAWLVEDCNNSTVTMLSTSSFLCNRSFFHTKWNHIFHLQNRKILTACPESSTGGTEFELSSFYGVILREISVPDGKGLSSQPGSTHQQHCWAVPMLLLLKWITSTETAVNHKDLSNATELLGDTHIPFFFWNKRKHKDLGIAIGVTWPNIAYAVWEFQQKNEAK